MSRHVIRVYDTETQGFEPEHLVCELGWCDVVHDGEGWRIGDHGSSLQRVDEMPPQARAVHHISAAETQAFPPFDPEAMWAKAKVDGVNVVAAHFWTFDSMRFGEAQLPAICTMKAARRVWPTAPAHGNGVLRYWLEDQGAISPDPALTLPPHRAGPDAYVTAHVLLALLTEATAAQMVAWTKQPLVFHVWGFGKHKGKAFADTPADYLDWVANKPNELDADTKWNCQRELDRRREARAE